MDRYRDPGPLYPTRHHGGPPPPPHWADPYASAQGSHRHDLGFFGPALPSYGGRPPPYGGGFRGELGRGGPPPGPPQHRGGNKAPRNKAQQQQWRGGQPQQGGGAQAGVSKRRGKKHKGGAPVNWTGRETPGSVPPAPYNSNSYLATANGHQTPSILGSDYHNVTPNPHGTVWKNTAPALDKETMERAREAGVDPFSGNDDLMLAVGLVAREFGDDEEDVLGWSDEDMGGALTDQETSTMGAQVAARLKRQLQTQAALIAELEERNLNLDEKVYVLERELKELRAQLAGGHGADQLEGEEAAAAAGGGGQHDGGGAADGGGDAAEHAGSSSGVDDVDGQDHARQRHHSRRRHPIMDQGHPGLGREQQGPGQGQEAWQQRQEGHGTPGDEQLQGPGEVYLFEAAAGGAEGEGDAAQMQHSPSHPADGAASFVAGGQRLEGEEAGDEEDEEEGGSRQHEQIQADPGDSRGGGE